MMALLGAGIFLRLYPSAGYAGLGQDEGSYAIFVKQTQKVGFWNYDAVVQAYVARQYGEAKAGVPATRIGFLAPAVWAANVFHLEPLPALRLISALGSLLLLLATAAIGYRHGGTARMLVLTALMAVAPLQIALAQRALIDGYFAWAAVLTAWFFWECRDAPRSRGWLAAYGTSLFVLVLTKENAAFVYAALMATGL
ncbi:MAG: phospholipid carrier-dependent glycosyltransferase, partial [Chthoniobacterales bacterium]